MKPMLSIVEEASLIGAGQAGDSDAVVALCTQYEPLVLRVARRYPMDWRDDAIQEGYMALLGCIQSYDPSHGVRFAGFAQRMVHGSVRSAWRRDHRYADRKAVVRDADGSYDPIALVEDHSTHHGYDSVELHQALDGAGLSQRESQYIAAMLAGYSAREMAAEAGVSVETVKTWRQRAFRKARAVL